MSADLFAEFDAASTAQPAQSAPQGGFGRPVGSGLNSQGLSASPFGRYESTQQQSAQPSSAGPGNFASQPAWGVQNQPNATVAWPSLDLNQAQGLSIKAGAGMSETASGQIKDDDDDDDDGWGDFEVAAPPHEPAKTPAQAQKPTGTWTSNQNALADMSSWNNAPSQQPAPQRTRIVRADTIDLMTNNLLGTSTSTPAPVKQQKPSFSQADLLDWDKTSNFRSSEPVVDSRTAAAVKPVVKATTKPSLRDASSDILFDVDDYAEGADFGGDGEDDDDDFGDFETGTTTLAQADLLSLDSAVVPMAKAPGTMSLSSLSINNNDLSRFPAPKSPSYQERNPFPGLYVTTPPADVSRKLEHASTRTPSTAWPSAGVGKRSPTLDDGWAAFEDIPKESKKSAQVAKPKPKVSKAKAPAHSEPAQKDSSWDWGFDDETSATEPSKSQQQAQGTRPDTSWDWESAEPQPTTITHQDKDELPPINIPPPSVLISIFPQLLGQANTFLFKPTANQGQSIKDRVLANPKTLEFLRGYLTLARVASRVIAGRKSRWHRDKFLAQSMSISAAGSKGMKLAGVDKAQIARESREAGDVVDLWKESVGRLRSAVAAVNSGIPDANSQLRVPELAENMHVTTAKDVPTAAKACIICGLKREERVAKVDHNVEDSFGEWWSDHWGHVECKRFWLQHETALRQR